MNYEVKKTGEVNLRKNSGRGRKSKYGPLAEQINKLNGDECVVVNCKEGQQVETLRNSIHQSLKKHMSGFGFGTRVLDDSSGVAIFKKELESDTD